ncbi:hypothetical protein AGMMS50212_12730 [Spirochaetia bacterium]|nr:hypothetical protein AGMMS50212_12730 [Spirochaetia bacterium]
MITIKAVKIHAIVLLILMFTVSCVSKKNDVNEIVNKVEGHIVESKNLENKIDGFGALSYQKKIDVTAVQDAEMYQLNVREGDNVKKDQIIAVTKNPHILLALGRSQNALSQAQAALDLARAKLLEGELRAEAQLISLEKADAEMKQAWIAYNEEERKQKARETLFEAGGVNEEAIREARFKLKQQFNSLELAEKDLEIKRIGFRDKDLIAAGMKVPSGINEKTKAFVRLSTVTARAELEAAAANRDSAQKELESSQLANEQLIIRSPISGVLVVKYFEEGERIKREDKIVTIIDTEYLYAVFPVRESDAFRIENGMNAVVDIDGTSSSYNGIVDLVSPVADSKSFTFSVRVLLSNNSSEGVDEKDSNLFNFAKPGMFARVSINLGNPRSIIALKDAAIISKNNDEGIVFIVNGKTVSERKIILGESIGDEWEILDGLKAGEVAVLHPDSNLQDGSYVYIAE